MKFQETKDIVLKELETILSGVKEKEIDELIETMLQAEKIFVMGIGRVRLMSQAFAKRLVHLGLKAYVVGDITAPPISSKDLLIAGSASGETMATVNIAKLARKYKAGVYAVTARPDSTLGKTVTAAIVLPGPTKLKLKGEIKTLQAMGSLFEQGLLILYDSVAMILKEKLKQSEEDLWSRHDNLE